MYYIYILYSTSADKFYVGFSEIPFRRLVEHHSNPRNTFTSRHRPWELKAVFECSNIQAEAMRIEKFIKAQKSRRLLMLLCEPDFVPKGELGRLVRVPHLRD